MAKPISLKQFVFEYGELMTAFSDDNNEKVVFISKNGGETHLLIECLGGQLVLYPIWHVNMATTDNPKEYVIELKFPLD